MFSTAIYVRFRLENNDLLSKLLSRKKFYLKYFSKFFFLESNIGNIYAIIWTTTPWSLIGNQAVAVNEKLKYLFIKLFSTNDVYIIAEPLLNNIKKFSPFSNNQFEIIETCLGKKISLIFKENNF
jgi:isoleucyl-tRNA synthetase